MTPLQLFEYGLAVIGDLVVVMLLGALGMGVLVTFKAWLNK